jgi:prepilin-type N-terminal cleavage/methylation domain-containing protein
MGGPSEDGGCVRIDETMRKTTSARGAGGEEKVTGKTGENGAGGTKKMIGKNGRAGAGGYTLVELLVVMAIITILLVAMGTSFVGWRGRYRVESQIRQMYSDLMNSRAKAIQRKRAFFLVLGSTSYSIYEDTFPSPDGNGTFEAASDTLIVNTTLNYTIQNTASMEVGFTKTGLVDGGGLIRFGHEPADENPYRDYDCIEISATRINLGVGDLSESGDDWVWDSTCQMK